MFNLSKNAKITRVSYAVAAGQATTNCTSVDMKGFDGVTFLVAMGTIASTGTVAIKAQESSDNSSFSDLAGTALAYTDTDDNKLAVLEVVRPLKRYVRAVITTATANGTIDGAIAIQTMPNIAPITASTTVVATGTLASPAEGTP